MLQIHSPLPAHAEAKARTVRHFLEACWCEGLLQGAIQETTAGNFILVLMGRSSAGLPRIYDIDIGGTGTFGRLRLAGPLRRGGGAAELDIASLVGNLTRHLKPDEEALQRCITAVQNDAFQHSELPVDSPVGCPSPLQRTWLAGLCAGLRWPGDAVRRSSDNIGSR